MRHGFLRFAAAVFLILAARPLMASADADHSAWDALVRVNVDARGNVDYAAMQQQSSVLDRYLVGLASVDLATLSPTEQLALWINAYNAGVVKAVIDRYPIGSVKEAKGFFDRIKFKVGGKSWTLNRIEEKATDLGDWRIRFTLACAAASCPPLRAEAYASRQIGTQLTDQTRRFLADPGRGLRLEPDTLWASKIFEWHDKDFLPDGKMNAKTLMEALAPYAESTVLNTVRQGAVSLKFMGFDWSLNAQSG
jgi:hypothetical protein